MSASNIAMSNIAKSKIAFIIDCTASMENNIQAIANAMQQLYSIMKLCGLNISVQFILFRDYSVDICEWTIKISPVMTDFQEVISFISSIQTRGNSDIPEACKTALFEALELIDENTIVFLYTDAPPHEDITLENLRKNNPKYKNSTWKDIMSAFTDLSATLTITQARIYYAQRQRVANSILEAAKLGPYYSQWLNIINHDKYKTLRDKNQIYIFSNTHNANMVFNYSALGTYINMKITSSSAITNITIGVFLNLIGVPFSQDVAILSTFQVLNTLFGKIEIGNVQHNFYPFPCIEDIRCNITEIITKFRSNDTFKNLVFTVLEKLITPTYVMSLTTNDIFGKLWRECCKQRENPMLTKLQNAISACCTSAQLGGDYTAPAQLKKWIEKSYDNTEDILEYFKKAIEDMQARGETGRRYIQLLVSDSPQMTREDILEIGRGTATFDSLRKIVQFLINVRIVYYYPNPEDVNHPDDTNILNKITTLPNHYVPMCLQMNKFFSYLGHLMCSGTLFSTRSACILAILAYQSANPVFQNRAERFLRGMIGRWLAIDKVADYPELLSVSFIRLLEKVPWALTDKEQKYFKKYYDFTQLRAVQNLDVDTQLSWVPSKGSTYCDEKWLCHTCDNMRPLSLMVHNGVCVFCNDTEMAHESLDGKYNNECSIEKSYLVMCRNNECRGIYAIQRIKNLQCEPKCHYCRCQLPICNVECQTCHNQFVVPDKTMIADQVTSYKCAMCTNCPEQTVIEKIITLGTLIDENPSMKPLFGVAQDVNLHMQGSLFKNRDAIPECDSTVQAEIPDQKLKVNHRHVHNVSSICSSLPDQIKNGEHSSNCAICYGDFHISKLTQLCGHCNNKVCHDCGVHWYSTIKQGELLQPAHLCCAFCKKRPQFSIIRAFNPNMTNLMGARQIQFDIRYYYGWCRTCNNVKIAGDVACGAADAEPDYHGRFECDDCRSAYISAQPNINVKMCPNTECGVATEKISGCNHITCANCHIHWCYVCQEIFPYEQIYRHLSIAHGGFFDEDVGVAGAAPAADDYTDDDEY
jgi:hypothetical protein